MRIRVHITLLLSLTVVFATGTVHAQPQSPTPYPARAFTPANGDLARSAGVPAQLANAEYVEALARLVYYWAYPGVDIMARTSQWQLMKDGPGVVLGIFPGAPVNTSACLSDYMSPAQRMVVTPNSDTIYMSGLADLGREPVVVQTPVNVPKGHYWTIQIADVFANVVHQIGSAAGTPGGKYLLVGPEWKGEKPAEFIDVLRLTTNIGWIPGRSFAAHTPESKAESVAVLNQIRIYPLSQNKPGQQVMDCRTVAQNAQFPPGLTAEKIAADPYAFRPEWVNPKTFWDDLEKMLAANPTVGPSDTPMADQARTLVALRKSNAQYKDLLDRAALAAKGVLLDGRYAYTMTFPKDALPPVDRTRGGFWSLTMYDKDYFMLPKPANGRNNIGTVSLDAKELKFAPDGSLTITISSTEPTDAVARANWLPSPDGQFALIVRTYVPTKPILDGSYHLPNVERK